MYELVDNIFARRNKIESEVNKVIVYKIRKMLDTRQRRRDTPEGLKTVPEKNMLPRSWIAQTDHWTSAWSKLKTERLAYVLIHMYSKFC